MMWPILETIETQFYNIIGAVIILAVGVLVGLIVKKILKKVLHEVEVDKAVGKLGKDYQLEKRISSVGAYLIYFIAILMALKQLGITSIVLYIVLGAVLLLVGATVLLGVKDFIPNLIGGIVVSKKGYQKGDKIKVNEIEGKIEKLGLLEMEVVTKKRDKIYVPNSLLNKSKVLLRR